MSDLFYVLLFVIFVVIQIIVFKQINKVKKFYDPKKYLNELDTISENSDTLTKQEIDIIKEFNTAVDKNAINYDSFYFNFGRYKLWIANGGLALRLEYSDTEQKVLGIPMSLLIALTKRAYEYMVEDAKRAVNLFKLLKLERIERSQTESIFELYKTIAKLKSEIIE